MSSSNTRSSSHLKSKSKKVKEPRNVDFVEEFNTIVPFIQQTYALKELSDNKEATQKLESNLSELYNGFKKLIANEYFLSVYTNHVALKQVILTAIELIFESTNEELKLKSYQVVEELLRIDINVEELLFRSTTVKYLIQTFLNNSIIPHLVSILDKDTCSFRQDPDCLVVVESQAKIILQKLDSKCLQNMFKVVSYCFVTMPFKSLVRSNFVPRAYEFFSDKLSSTMINTQIILSISVNLCDTLSNETDHTCHIDTNLASNRQIYEEDQTKLLVFNSCIDKAIDSLRNNIRCADTRPLHKQALDIYTKYLDNYLKRLRDKCGLFMEMDENDENSPLSLYEQWQQLLYKLIIGIIRILRCDFESNENQLEIDLVIYFYELVKLNIKHLADTDSTNIAFKLVGIIVKLYDWSERMYRDRKVKETQKNQSQELSFELIIAFIDVLKMDFCTNHWTTFEPLWVKCISDWNASSYKVISVFLKYYNNPESFSYVKTLSKTILRSWTNPKPDESLSDCVDQMKSIHLFLKDEILDAIIDLAVVYDKIILTNKLCYQDFEKDLHPTFQIINSLFKIDFILNPTRLNIFIRYYTRLFVFKSALLLNGKLWKDDIEAAVINLNKIVEHRFDFELDYKTFEAAIKMIESIKLVLSDEEKNGYQYLFDEIYRGAEICKNDLMYEHN